MKTIDFFKELYKFGSIDKVLQQHSGISNSDVDKFFGEVFEKFSETSDKNNQYELYTDGASKGNPGDAGIGFVIKKDNFPIEEVSKYIGKTTNNVAEYTAFIEGLKRLQKLGIDEVCVFSDSELMVKQVNGIYSVKNEQLKKLYLEAKNLIKNFKKFKLTHIPREKNTEADRLSKQGSLSHST